MRVTDVQAAADFFDDVVPGDVCRCQLNRHCRLLWNVFHQPIEDLDDATVGDRGDRQAVGMITGIFALIAAEGLAIVTELHPIDRVALRGPGLAIQHDNGASMRGGIRWTVARQPSIAGYCCFYSWRH